MWIGIILGVIALLIIGNWIYTTINTKNIVEYHPNGKTKLIGVSYLNKRIGVFEMFDEEGNLTSKINYVEGKIIREDFYNPLTGKSWRTAFHNQDVVKNEITLKNAPPKIQSNRNIVLDAVRLNGLELEFASEELRNDREIVLEAVKINAHSIEFISERLFNEKDFIIKLFEVSDLIKSERINLKKSNFESL
ncbi:MAG: DUF4116 domain-containing protein, partial [Bacteroidota bacterium]